MHATIEQDYNRLEQQALGRERGSGATAAEMFRCSECRALVVAEYAVCNACGFGPTGEHNKHRKFGPMTDRRRRLQNERRARQRRDRLS